MGMHLFNHFNFLGVSWPSLIKEITDLLIIDLHIGRFQKEISLAPPLVDTSEEVRDGSWDGA